MTIKDSAPMIEDMSPIEIYINTTLYWADNGDLTHMTEKQAHEYLKNQYNLYKEILDLELEVTDIHYTIVSNHHSKVYISTI